MDILSNLQNLLRDAAGPQSNAASPQARTGASGADGLGGLLDSNMLGGLLGALLSGKEGMSGASASSSSMGGAGGAGGLGALGGLLGSLMSGGEGGGGVGGLLSQLIPQSTAPASAPKAPASPQNRAINLVRTLVYAAKADGHIDQGEQAAINSQVGKLGLGAQAQAMINQVMDEPLDPNRIASNVGDAQEAVQLYALSCALTNMDHFMERSYLDNLASALRIPADAKAKIESRITGR